MQEAADLAAGEDGSKRLEGTILRSQLLVLLQRRHFVDREGNPVRGGRRGWIQTIWIQAIWPANSLAGDRAKRKGTREAGSSSEPKAEPP